MDHLDPDEPRTLPFRCPRCGDRIMVTLPPKAAVGHIGAATCGDGHFVAYRFDGARLTGARDARRGLGPMDAARRNRRISQAPD